jgi:superfamily II DNA or RNA helicase
VTSVDSVELFEHQRDFLDGIVSQPAPARACLYFKTGAGKSMTAMLGMRTLGYEQVLVIAPPSTHEQWEKLADSLGMMVSCMSHAKFRMKDTKLSKAVPIIADESHMFGGHKGQGWKKLDTLAMHLQAPLFLLSATPQYNDAERVYCIVHVLDPHNNKGGYLSFLYTHCVTKQNPFALEPLVEGFKNFGSAEEFLAAHEYVYYLPDDTVFTIDDIPWPARQADEFEVYNYDRRKHRVLASQIEKRHARINNVLIGTDGFIDAAVMAEIQPILDAPSKLLVYANHATVAMALARTLAHLGPRVAVVTGAHTKAEKDRLLTLFKTGGCDILIGTATLATGTDGLDKVCDTLLILDDTDDDALRRQLIGRIMPRGEDTDASSKKIIRLLLLT